MGQILIWAGAGLTCLGLAGLIWVIVSVARAQRQGAEVQRAQMQKMLPVNLGAIAVSTIGLMTVVIGIMLR